MNAPVSIPARHRTAAILTLLLWLVAGSLHAQDVEIDWEVIATGGGIGLANDQHRLSFTVGQPIVGPISGTISGLAATLYQGFWFPLARTTSVDAPVTTSTATSTLHAIPNPFSTTTAITCRLDHAGYINVVVFDLLGRPVRQLLSGMMEAGTHRIAWDGRDEQGKEVPAGHYICRMGTDNSIGKQSIGSVILQHL